MHKSSIIFILSLPGSSLTSQIVISNLSLIDTTQNIFYIGIDNSIKITGKQYEPLRQSVSIRGGGAELIPRGPGSFNVKVQSATDTCQMSIYENRKLIFKKNFFCREMGDLVLRYGGLKDSIATISQLLANPFLYLGIPGSYYKHNLNITSFTATFIGNKFDSLKTYSIGNKLTAEQTEIIKKLGTGDKIYFDQIYALSPDSRRRKLKSFTITIR